MFTLDQITAAHGETKTGADFPRYIQNLILLGVQKFDTYVVDNHSEYFGSDGYKIQSDPKYAALVIADIGNSVRFKKCLKLHQQGGTDYMTFCQDAADTGVHKWTVDMSTMTCTYYDNTGNVMVVESIPVV